MGWGGLSNGEKTLRLEIQNHTEGNQRHWAKMEAAIKIHDEKTPNFGARTSKEANFANGK